MRPESRRPTDGRSLERPGATYYAPGERSVPQLFRELADEGVDLVREEIALAKAEMNEKLESYRKATMSMGAGGAMLLAALLTLLWTANRGLTALLTLWVGLDVAVWLSPLVLTVVLGAIGASLLGAGKKRMKSESLTPRRTKATLQENARWMKAKAHEMRTEGKNA